MDLNADSAPLLVDDIGEDGELVLLVNFMGGLEVRKLVAGFLSGHALLNPFFAAPMLLPCFSGALQGEGWVSHFLHPLETNLGEPEFNWLGLWARNTLDEAE